jgi:hypothetical protein
MSEKNWSVAGIAATAGAMLALSIPIGFFRFTDLLLYSIVFPTIILLLAIIQGALPTQN